MAEDGGDAGARHKTKQHVISGVYVFVSSIDHQAVQVIVDHRLMKNEPICILIVNRV